jgi:peptidyl-prolyl cis-trans isomerase A (cyclophilin A)
MARRFLAFSFAVFLASTLVAAAPTSSWKEKPGMYAIIETTQGRMVCELYPQETPKTVANFTGLANGTREFTDSRTGAKAKRNFYDGIIFHRVIPEFMIQTGDPLGTGTGGPGYQFEDEIVPQITFDRPGRLAMANAGPNTNGSQFFITEVATPWLNGHHTIFGQVIEGQETVTRIARVERGMRDKPVQDVIIKSITIQTTAEKKGQQALSGKKILMIVAPQNFRDEEYFEPRKILEDAGAQVTTASLVTGPVTGARGGTATADILLSAAQPDDYAAIVFIGGSGAEVYRDNPDAHRLAAAFTSAGKPVAAICIAPAILANAGVLKGKKATAFSSAQQALTDGGAIVTPQPVVQDGLLITANGPEAAGAFGQALLAQLRKP